MEGTAAVPPINLEGDCDLNINYIKGTDFMCIRFSLAPSTKRIKVRNVDMTYTAFKVGVFLYGHEFGSGGSPYPVATGSLYLDIDHYKIGASAAPVIP